MVTHLQAAACTVHGVGPWQVGDNGVRLYGVRVGRRPLYTDTVHGKWTITGCCTIDKWTELKTLLEKGLSVTEKLILTLYYYEELTMKDIGRTLDLSESRVSQLHSSILARLKSHLQHREERDEEE